MLALKPAHRFPIYRCFSILLLVISTLALAVISHMDEQVGRILQALEASGMADNTYVFFTADHGLSVGDHG